MTTAIEGDGLLVCDLSGDIIILQCSDLRFYGRVEVGDGAKRCGRAVVVGVGGSRSEVGLVWAGLVS